MDIQLVARRVKQARNLSNLSQRQLGEKLGVSDKTISAYEAERAVPPLHTLKKIAEVTGKPIEFFFEDEKPKANLQSVEAKLDTIIELLRKLNEK
jgi:transcriptional regulator with XRE-family HTH domain